MPDAPDASEAPCAAQLAAERACHAQTTAELAALKVRVAALEQQLSAAAGSAQRQRTQVLAAQREFYEAILNALPVEVVVWDDQQRSVFINSAALPDPVRRGQAIRQLPGGYFALYDSAPPPLAVSEQREYQFSMAADTSADVIFEELTTDAQQQQTLIMRHLRPVCHPNGTLRLTVSLGIDITARLLAERQQEQRKVQAMLRSQQKFIQQIMDTLPNALYLVNADGSLTSTNRAFRDMAAITRHSQGDATDPVVQEELRQITLFNQQVLATGQAETRELTFTTVAGEKIYYQVYKRPIKQVGGQTGVFTITTDVTALRKASLELERREKQYHDLVHYSQALICTHDLEGRLLSVNPAIERLMGAPATQLVGHNLREALLPERHSAFQAYLDGDESLLAQPRIASIRTHTGELHYLQYYTYRVTEEGYPPYVVASGYDVTEGHLAQQALRQAKQQAEENTQAKEAFLSRMSHEIRTPLNGVLGMAALLQKTDLTTAQQEYLRTMQHAGRHLLALVNDVLDMAKITAQHVQLENAPFDLALVLQGAGQTMAALAEQKGLAFTVEPLATDPARVVGDAYRLHQVLLNLLGNAIKFTETGSVRLGADVLHDTPTGLTLRFWVADTGIGMTADEQAHIFEAFAQANAETSRRFGGTGLGLAISQQLVAQMGGTLTLRSEPGQGTVFSFRLVLPRAAASAAPVPATPGVSCEKLRGRRILLAEDNLVNQQIARIVLENQGVHVTAVDNGLAALAQLENEDYDAAILDIRMPGLSGVEVTIAVRHQGNAHRAGIPIIALTANAFEADRATYLAAGMNACLTKPYEEAALCQLLLDLTEKS
ncbi:PAS domain S-box protein [Hymenobacter sp. M29]|uniref:histidine kinase n=1 Tax=Hymenobacter mellowenesis TaxID=3063995 RepID=A0ABT9A6V2_9BACT|nr:PAS domain S-box protein [Hymenobacter sp. M29]MDO7845564.1 PAS domain S-box protein [Hymenobacter sp. M29]